jgi:hemerythrin-like domain-containing protein
MMTADANAPADTRMMGIVHDALRRDLDRALRTLSSAPFPQSAQREAIGAHIVWMMDFLHAHHHGEDAGLWPLVRARDPRAAAFLDAMEADHARVAPLVDECRAAARHYAAEPSDDARVALLDALRAMGDALLPHLRREEDETIPLVAVAISAAEWHAVDQEYFMKDKSMAQLGFEGHWLMDGLDPERREVLVHQVPPVPRLILVHGFARGYRRHATECWGPVDPLVDVARRKPYGPASPLPRAIPRAGRVDEIVAASLGAVWRVVSDVTRVGEWSHECRRAEWLDGATSAEPGVRFRGTSKAGPWAWSRVNEIVVVREPHALVWRTVPTLLFPDSTEWRIELEPVDGGTRIAQSFDVVRAPAVLSRLYAIMIPAHRGRDSALTDDLRRLGAVAGSSMSAVHAAR